MLHMNAILAIQSDEKSKFKNLKSFEPKYFVYTYLVYPIRNIAPPNPNL